MNHQGLIFCSRYAVAPNFFGYCGPSKTSNIINHLKENIADFELQNILSDFETLFPYLQLIARKNKIVDPFDRRVVEAYWIGNEFLKPLSPLEYQAFAQEKLFLKKKLKRESLINLKFKIKNLKFLPHHAFHVFNIFRRTGHNSSFHTLETIDGCRIGWGKVIKYQISNIKYQKDISKIKNIFVETKQLTINNKQLSLTESVVKELRVDYNGKSFSNNLQTGDWVSFHWGFVCDILTERQVKSLEFYTQKAIEFYNL